MCHQDVGPHWGADEVRQAQGLLSPRALQRQDFQVRGGSGGRECWDQRIRYESCASSHFGSWLGRILTFINLHVRET